MLLEEPPAEIRPPETLEVHGEERRVGDDVADAQGVVELEAVEEPRPVGEAEDVVGQQIAVPVAAPAVGDPLLEQRPSPVEIRLGGAEYRLARRDGARAGGQRGELGGIAAPPLAQRVDTGGRRVRGRRRYAGVERRQLVGDATQVIAHVGTAADESGQAAVG